MFSKPSDNDDESDFSRSNADEVEYANLKKTFGERVVSLRQERKWTRLDLITHIGMRVNTRIMSSKTMGDIERGEKAFLNHATVKHLADAFSLNGLAREEFFGLAGLKEISEAASGLTAAQEDLIDASYRGLDYPAYVHDQFMNLHSANSYLFVTFGFKLDEQLSSLFLDRKANLLRMLFDPRLDDMMSWIKGKQWRRHVERLVYMFRVLSKNYVGTREYLALLRELRRLPDFPDVWKAVEHPNFMPQFLVPTRFSLKTGEHLDFSISSNYDTPLFVSTLTRVLFTPCNDQTKAILASTVATVSPFYAKINLAHPQGFKITPI